MTECNKLTFPNVVSSQCVEATTSIILTIQLGLNPNILGRCEFGEDCSQQKGSFIIIVADKRCWNACRNINSEQFSNHRKGKRSQFSCFVRIKDRKRVTF